MRQQQLERFRRDGFVDHGYLVDAHLGAPDPDARPMWVTTRPMSDDDSMLLFELYVAGRADEISRSGWVTPQQRSFFRAQALKQEQHLTRHYDHLYRRTICINGFSVGRMLVDCEPSAFTLVDIGLLPGFRGRGIGTLLIRCLLDEAAHAHVPVYLEIDEVNRALNLAYRLGFGDPVDLCSRVRLIWTPPVRLSAPGSSGPATELRSKVSGEA